MFIVGTECSTTIYPKLIVGSKCGTTPQVICVLSRDIQNDLQPKLQLDLYGNLERDLQLEILINFGSILLKL